MPTTVQEFLADATQRTMTELVEALLRLPEDKRAWKPSDTARSAIDLVAECAINNGVTADLVVTRKWAASDYSVYLQKKAALAAGDWETLKTLLETNTQKFIDTVRAVPTEDLDIPVETPYGTGPLSGIGAYPYWNMSYHLGQINYIASILGLP
jgi:hypothetical protein